RDYLCQSVLMEAIDDLAKRLADQQGSKRLASSMADWFSEKPWHYREVMDHEEKLYDEAFLRECLSRLIAEACNPVNDRGRDHAYLRRAMELPSGLIDRDNPEIEGFVKAYDRVHQE
ncbi:hypothetical protein ACFL0V_03115, partial [Nanoarchaeota archaeon]